MSMPRAVRHINEVRLLDALRRHGRASRADLARELGLMRSTVGHLVAGLVAQGVILEAEPGAVASPVSSPASSPVTSPASSPEAAPGRGGRPGQQLRLNPDHAIFIGAELGVGHLSLVAVDLVGQAVARHRAALAPVNGATAYPVEPVVAALAAALRTLVGPLAPARMAALRGLCVTVPGLVDARGQVLRAPVLGWQQVPLAPLLQRQLRPWVQQLRRRLAREPDAAAQGAGPDTLLAPVLENDAKAFAAAEHPARASGGAHQARGTGSAGAQALYVYLDAGIGGGLVVQGEPLRGQHGVAGEIGHILIGEGGFDPQAPLAGSFESYAGRGAVLARYRQHGGRGGSLEALLAALQAGQPAARRTLDEWAWWMGRGLASLASVLDPGRIVLGGPVAALYPWAEAAVTASMHHHQVSAAPQPVIELSPLGPQACAFGGAMLLHRRFLALDEQLVFGASPQAG